MRGSYIERIQKLSEKLSDPNLAVHARKMGSNTFSRNRKMSLKDILLCCLSKKGPTTALELRNYFKQKGDLYMEISKQGYLQQRKRLNPEVLSYLNDEYLADFYHSSEQKLWNGFLLLAIDVDGSKAEVPNSAENRERFGKSNNQHSELGQIRALVSGMYDILNQFYWEIEISHISTSETNLPFDISQKELEDLYFQRWEIEKKYHTLKNKMKFESVTGKSTIYVDQDFRAQVLVYNMIQDIRKEANDKVSVKGRKKNCRYPMHTNENIAIGLFKEQMIKLILEKHAERRGELLFELQAELEEHILPQRKLPGKERKKNISNKYKNNQKSSF